MRACVCKQEVTRRGLVNQTDVFIYIYRYIAITRNDGTWSVVITYHFITFPKWQKKIKR